MRLHNTPGQPIARLSPSSASGGSGAERRSDLSKVTQRAGDRDGFRAWEGAFNRISLSLFFIAFENETQLLNIITPVIDFQLELHPEMLNDKYSYYPSKHSVKLIASICLRSVRTRARGGTRLRRRGAFQRGFGRGTSCVSADCPLARLKVPGKRGDADALFGSAWPPHQDPTALRLGDWAHRYESRPGAGIQREGSPPALGVRPTGKPRVRRSVYTAAPKQGAGSCPGGGTQPLRTPAPGSTLGASPEPRQGRR